MGIFESARGTELQQNSNGNLSAKQGPAMVVLDLRHDQLFVQGRPIKLEPLAVGVLEILSRHQGKLVDRKTLIDELWRGDWLVGDPALSRVISEIRSVTGDDPKRPELIKTLPRKGYLLLQPVVSETLGVRDDEPSWMTNLRFLGSGVARFLWLVILLLLASALVRLVR